MSAWGRRMRAGAIGTAAFAASPAAAGLGAIAPADDVPIWRVIGALLLCLAVALAGALALRARTGAAGPGLPGLGRRPARLRLRETIRVGPHVQLCIVRCDRHDLLLATGPAGAQLLRQLDDPAPLVDIG